MLGGAMEGGKKGKAIAGAGGDGQEALANFSFTPDIVKVGYSKEPWPAGVSGVGSDGKLSAQFMEYMERQRAAEKEHARNLIRGGEKRMWRRQGI